MPSAEVIAIGTELLLGEIQDTNTRFLARNLRDIGLDLYRATLIGDNQHRIAEVIKDAFNRADIVITTGGLGPTVDDPTRQAVAMAFDTDLEFRSELWDEIQERFSRYGRIATANNRRQAFIPCGAQAISNPVGTAPAFLISKNQKTLISLPGVPKEMEHLLISFVIPFLKQKYQLSGLIKARVLHTAGIGESMVDELIGDLEELENPTVGLLAHPGQTDIRITAKAGSIEQAEKMIDELSQNIQGRLGDSIYGIDDTRIETIVHKYLVELNSELVISHSGFDDQFLNRITPQSFPAITITELDQNNPLQSILPNPQHHQILCNAVFTKDSPVSYLSVSIESLGFSESIERSFGSAPEMASLWAENTILDIVRRKLNQIINQKNLA